MQFGQVSSTAAAGFTVMDEGALREKANEINLAKFTLHDVLNLKVNYGGVSRRSPSGVDILVNIQDNTDGTSLFTHKSSETGSHLLYVFLNHRQIKEVYLMFKLAVLVATKKLVFPSVEFGSLGSGDGLFNMPWGSAIDQMDGIYVSDRCYNRI